MLWECFSLTNNQECSERPRSHWPTQHTSLSRRTQAVLQRVNCSSRYPRRERSRWYKASPSPSPITTYSLQCYPRNQRCLTRLPAQHSMARSYGSIDQYSFALRHVSSSRVAHSWLKYHGRQYRGQLHHRAPRTSFQRRFGEQQLTHWQHNAVCRV